MSMPSIKLNCNKCDFESNTRILWGGLNYFTADGELPIEKQLGWCKSCDSFAPIESFEHQKAVTTELDSLSTKLMTLQKRSLVRRIFMPARKEYKNIVKQIYALSKILSLINQRKGTEKCLTCGSANVFIPEGDFSQKATFGGFSSQDFINTGFTHPGCGGEVITSQDPLRISAIFITQLYNTNGILLPEHT
jgi:hypothetical protein